MNYRILSISFLFLVQIICFNLSAQTQLPRISVVGNNFVNEKQETMVFRGLNASDPDKLETQGHWTKSYFQEMKNWGANIVRLPVHPTAWSRRGKEDYLRLLDQAVEWATELDLYLIIDWHSIGNLKTEMFQDGIYDTSLKQTYDFWRTIAVHYGKHNTVAFYELYNEPTTYHNTLGTISWDWWKSINEEFITIIRANGGEGVPLVAGFNWAYDLIPVRDQPLEVEGIGYVSHPYPEKKEKPWKEKWTADWGFVKENYPIILTEIGFCGPDDVGAHSPVIGDESYGDAITNYCDANEISYIVWVFDAEWAPRLFQDWENYKPSRHGKYFKKKLQSYTYE